MATATADLGVDHRECKFVFVFEWPDSISTFKQWSGRGSRDGRDSITLLVAGLSLLVALAKRTHRRDDAPLDELDENENNNIISESTTRSSSNKQQCNKTPHKLLLDHKLSRQQCKRLVSTKLLDFDKVLQIFNLNLGCQHKCLEISLQSNSWAYS